MTVGELATLFNEHFAIGASLRVISMKAYTRSMLWPDTGLAWVQTSPNIPEWDTTLVYPATGLIDSAGVNNGTGYTKPFKYAGAYKLDGLKLAEYLNARPIPGVHFRAASWAPISGFWEGKTLSGVELIVTGPRQFRAVRTAVEILVAVRKIAPGQFAINSAALDKDWGTDSLRRGLEDGLDVETILRRWEPATQAFETMRQRYLIYE
jgi:beta-N-acetylhexosaminidase